MPQDLMCILCIQREIESFGFTRVFKVQCDLVNVYLTCKEIPWLVRCDLLVNWVFGTVIREIALILYIHANLDVISLKIKLNYY